MEVAQHTTLLNSLPLLPKGRPPTQPGKPAGPRTAPAQLRTREVSEPPGHAHCPAISGEYFLQQSLVWWLGGLGKAGSRGPGRCKLQTGKDAHFPGAGKRYGGGRFQAQRGEGTAASAAGQGPWGRAGMGHGPDTPPPPRGPSRPRGQARQDGGLQQEGLDALPGSARFPCPRLGPGGGTGVRSQEREAASAW